ncbi:MAG: DUF459 domain-containing protein [Actinomycetota bacterium]
MADLQRGGAGTRDAGVYIPALDGIRALAILVVLAFHGDVPGTQGGYLGVSLFFTLSGFLMATILLRERAATGGIALVRFWEQRFRRLLPAAVVTLVGVATLAPHFADTTAREGLRGDLLGALGYVANWRFLSEGRAYSALFEAPSPVLHFWSLSIEEQFYFAFPLLIAGVCALGRGRLRVVAAVLGALFVASVASQLLVSGYDRAYYGTDTRAGELLAGALLACFVAARGTRALGSGRVATRLGVGALLVFVMLVVVTPIHASWVVHGGFGIIALCNVALIASALGDNVVADGLGARPLVAIGRVSYGLYLYHWPVFLWLDETRTGLSGVTLLEARLAVTAAIAIASYHMLECPIRYRRLFARRPRFVGVVATSLAVAIGLAVTAPQSVPVTSLFDERAFLPTPDAAVVAETVAHARPAPLRVMVVGDSTGHAVAEGLLATSDMDVLDATHPGCPLLHASTLRHFAADPTRDLATCATAPSQWSFLARDFKPDIVLVFNAPEDVSVVFEQQGLGPRDDLLARYHSIVEQYKGVAAVLATGGAVVAWADVPYFTFADDPDLRRRERLDLRVDALNLAITETVAGTPGLVLLDYARHLNTADRAVDLAVRPDGIHVATAPAQTAARTWLSTSVRQALEQARLELGVTTTPIAAGAAPPLRVLVVGDSTSLGLAAGLANHARTSGDLAVDWAGRVGCPLLDVASFRMFGPDPIEGDCPPTAELWAQRAAQFQPDVVLVFSSFMDSMDVKIGDVGWRHVGQGDYDARYAAQLDALVGAVAARGAVLVWSDAPRPLAHGQNGFLAKRFAALNALIAQADGRWRNVVTLPLASYIDGAGRGADNVARPDGIHFTVDAATLIAEDWLAAEVLARADEAITAARGCRSETGAISLDACREAA